MHPAIQDARHTAQQNLLALIRRLEGVKLGVDTNNKETIYAHSVGRNFIDQAYEAWASVATYLNALDEHTPSNQE
jgi:hypothetical protein